MNGMTAPPSTGPYIFKRDTADGRTIFDVRIRKSEATLVGKILSTHATLAEAEAALSNCGSQTQPWD